MKHKQKRSTLPSKIRNAKSTDEAIELALYGRKLSGIEQDAASYLTFSAIKDNILRGTAATRLCEQFLDAIDKLDGEPLRVLGSFIEAWKKRPGHSHGRLAYIHILKDILIHKGETMSAERLAKLIRWPAEAQLSQLKKLAKDNGFPLS